MALVRTDVLTEAIDDRAPLEHRHTPEAIRLRLAEGTRHSYVRDFIFGGIDGAVTTFAVVSGAAGAELGARVVLILGIANLVADGFSMATSNYVATSAERDELDHAAAVESRHIDTAPEGEREEVREIFRRKGIRGAALAEVVRQITADRDRWVATMLREEYGLPREVRSPMWAGVSTFGAFLLCGLVPLVPFVAGMARPFALASLATAAVFLGVGAIKGRLSARGWWRSALETLAIGSAAAAVAYAAGILLKRLV